jgi:uncharacterized protein (TIGR00255 family)
MINSMTGYGQAEGCVGSTDYAVEIRAVNNRYLRTAIKLPESCAYLEESVDKLLREQLQRGTVNYALRVRGAAAEALLNVDEDALRSLVLRLEALRRDTEVDARLDLASLLNLPGIVRPPEPTPDLLAEIKEKILALSREALTRLQAMRAAEGRFLEVDLQGHCAAIRQDLERIKLRSHTVIQDQADRLRKRVDSLLAEAKLKLDEETLAREVAILADRGDISEEIARLDSHLHQFQEACEAQGDQVGRRLDFISQEMLREANTIGSKASDVEIAQWVVNIKCAVDRIKEQVQNVE